MCLQHREKRNENPPWRSRRQQEEEERGEPRAKPEELDRIIIATVSGGCSRSKTQAISLGGDVSWSSASAA
jgi:hypothetical protein